jgi:Leucine-rich repeat (LRR) protein
LLHSLPASIGSATSLASFSAGNCELFGMVPLALGTLADMTHLWLNGNSLLETIPSELGNLAKLETLSQPKFVLFDVPLAA